MVAPRITMWLPPLLVPASVKVLPESELKKSPPVWTHLVKAPRQLRRLRATPEKTLFVKRSLCACLRMTVREEYLTK